MFFSILVNGSQGFLSWRAYRGFLSGWLSTNSPKLRWKRFDEKICTIPMWWRRYLEGELRVLLIKLTTSYFSNWTHFAYIQMENAIILVCMLLMHLYIVCLSPPIGSTVIMFIYMFFPVTLRIYCTLFVFKILHVLFGNCKCFIHPCCLEIRVQHYAAVI